MKSVREKIKEYIKTKYNVESERLWYKYPNYEVFRHPENKKWFAIIMDVEREELSIESSGKVDIVNVKCNNVFAFILEGKVLPAYHMNKKNWGSVLLDGSSSLDVILKLIDDSFKLTK